MDTITTIRSLLKSNGSAQPVTVALMPNDMRLIAAAPELLDALQAMYRAHHLHIFSPRGQETRSDRDTCRICGGNYRDTLQHITAQEGHPSDVKAEAAILARAAIARATGETP